MKVISLLLLILIASGCAHKYKAPDWSPTTYKFESEYARYATGNAQLSGQAFLIRRDGVAVKAAGRVVTLDPATTMGTEWWDKVGKLYVFRNITPPSNGFKESRRTTIADAEGRFAFRNLPSGDYYIRTEITWEIGGKYPTQGGLVGQKIHIVDKEPNEIILSQPPD